MFMKGKSLGQTKIKSDVSETGQKKMATAYPVVYAFTPL